MANEKVNNQQADDLNDQQQRRREKLQNYKDLGVDPYGHSFDVDSNSVDLKTKYDVLEPEQVDESGKVKIAGRIVLLRKMGKASFFTLQDKVGKIQVYIRQDIVGEENYALFKLADLGDICGIDGVMMKTKTGEVTIRATKYTHLVKALRPLPDKFHGLSDPEEKRRRRYVDLIVDDDSRRIAFLRPKIVRGIQTYMDSLGYTEVETSVLQPILGGANARPFVTHHNSLDQDFYLRIATELSLKRLLVGGMDRVYEIGKMFRNEGIDTTHNPEFTTMEAYQAYGDLSSMAKLTEDMFHYIADKVMGKQNFKWLGYDIDLSKPFKHVTMTKAIKDKIGVDFDKIKTLDEAIKVAKKYDVPIQEHFLWGHILNAFFEKFCEEDLVQPTFVYGHPLDISPLAKKDSKDERYTQRFEFYISTHEMCNAFTELNDPLDQRARFEEQLEEKKKGNDEASEVDEDYVEALEYGMPPAGGIGFGIDRLVMFFTESDSIRDVLLFPTMKRNK